ncbi:MAG: hypothetical protein JWO31_96, partial [Phycisphaerales bacterium]|nr:hypothetical protein [Phycisphaerales bacterium]
MLGLAYGRSTNPDASSSARTIARFA